MRQYNVSKRFSLSVLLSSIIFLTLVIHIHAANNVGEQFEEQYKLWRDACLNSDVFITSTGNPLKPGTEVYRYYENIVSLGFPVLPYLFGKMEQIQEDEPLMAALLTAPLRKLTKSDLLIISDSSLSGERVYYFRDLPQKKVGGTHAITTLWLWWWKEGRSLVPQQFETLYQEWNTLKNAGKTKEADAIYNRIKSLGIPILPAVNERISNGDSNLIPLVSYLTENDLSTTATINQVTVWWNSNKADWLLPPLE